MRSKKSESHAPTSGAKQAKKKKGFIRKSISRLAMLGVAGIGVKYFTDPQLGAARRKQILAKFGK